MPHSDIPGSKPARGSPRLFAACHVLHRLLVPRHPPNALRSFNILFHNPLAPLARGNPIVDLQTYLHHDKPEGSSLTRHAQEPVIGFLLPSPRATVPARNSNNHTFDPRKHSKNLTNAGKLIHAKSTVITTAILHHHTSEHSEF